MTTADASPPTASLSLLRRLEWRVRHAVENVLSGEYRSVFRGRGMEFDQVVKYTFGDDFRDIDWNVTARLGEPYRKKFVEEREITLMILFTDSVSLQFGSGKRTKREALLELGGLVALLGAVNRDRVGFCHVRPDGYDLTPPQRGRGAILHGAAGLIGRPAPDLLNRHSPAVPWKLLSRALPRHSIVLWLSDFPPAPPPEGWPVLQRRYQAMGFRVEDPWERGFRADSALPVFDPVTGRLVVLNPKDRTQRRAQEEWNRKRDEVWQSLFPNPLSRLTVQPDEPLLEALVRFFHARMHRR